MLVGRAAAPAQSQTAPTWPQKTVRFIVPLPPGSGMDLSARLVAERLTERWGQPVVVENRQGADGIPAVTAFLSARDNHTFLFSFAGIVTFNHLLHEKLPYDPKELVPVAPVIDNFLGVSASAVLKVEYARRAREGREGAARQAQLGGDAGPALLRPARVAEERRHRDGAGRLSRLRAGLSGPATRAGCMSPAPACRRWCRITGPAPPSSCS